MFLQKHRISFLNGDATIFLKNGISNPTTISSHPPYFLKSLKRLDDHPQRRVTDPQAADHHPNFTDCNPSVSDYDPSFADHDPRLADYDPKLADYNPDAADDDPGLTDYNPDGLDLNPEPKTGNFSYFTHYADGCKPVNFSIRITPVYSCSHKQANPHFLIPAIFSPLNINCMSNGRFPGKEADLNNYYQLVVPYLTTNAARLKISPDAVTALSSNFTAWNAAYPASQNPATRTQTVTDTKNLANQNMMSTLRTIFDDIPESVLTIEDRNTLNLQQRSTTRTAAPVPTTKPVVLVDTGNHLEHTISFSDENTPNSTAKPAGVRGCQIWMKVGSPAVDPGELQYVATDTASPYVNRFTGVNAGKPVYYWLRWENTRGETGPWSDAVMATIPA